MKALALRIDYLTGRSVATAHNDRERFEWPPHPARVYSALVATWYETEEQDDAERAALEWLASLGAPHICASEVAVRQVVPHFVPVNDTSVLKTLDRQREKASEAEDGLQRAQQEHEEARLSGDDKALGKAKKALSKHEKSLSAARKKLSEGLLKDQQPYPPDKRPDTGLSAARALLPEHRGKQPRSFPSATPDEPRVFLRWSAPAEEVELHLTALAALARRVVCIGHSSSLVSCSVVEDAPTPNWEPREAGDEVLRVPGPGQFVLLTEAHERHRGVEPRVLPCRFQRYERAGVGRESRPLPSVFEDEWIVLRQVGRRRMFQTACVKVARTMRAALMKYADDPVPELLSGHTASGQPLEKPHLAIVPLPNVGHSHASGELLGMALVFPRQAEAGEHSAVLRALGRWEEERRKHLGDEEVDTPPLELVLGRDGELELERIEWGPAPLATLRSSTWCRSSYVWVTATPIALDRNPGDLSARDPAKAAAAFEAAERSIAKACEHIGLPTPSYVQVHPSVPLVGAVKARRYPEFPAHASKTQRVKVHARLEFPQRVRGPVLLGAGRYHGLGLCRPLHREARVDA